MKRFLIVLSAAFVLIGRLEAATPNLINYQGRLTDGSGNPLGGTYSVRFTVYDAAVVGNSKWTETQNVTTDAGGLFAVVLGSIAPIPDTVFNSITRYLAVRVGADPEISPRTRLLSTPFSHRVNTVDGASGGTISSKLSVGPGHTNTGDNAFVAGYSNTVSGPGTSICGGWQNEASGGNAVIGGGYSNIAPGSYTVISGGADNEADGRSSAIGGGDTNRVFAGGYAATISGGRQNSASDTAAVVGGGAHNYARGKYSVVAGGGGPDVADSNSAGGTQSTVGGGNRNSASAYLSTVSGGNLNTASGDRSVIGGGQSHLASGSGSTIPGGYNNTARGDFSFAAGHNAYADSASSFVWSDGPDTHDSGPRQFVVRAAGGAYYTAGKVKVDVDAGASTTILTGEHWGDNSIIAWGKVSGGSGSISTNEFGVTSVVRNSAGNYTITLDATSSAAANLIPVANAEVDAAPNSAATARLVTIDQVSTTQFKVYICNGSFTPTDNDFAFIVTAR